MNAYYSKKFNKTLLLKSSVLLICLFFSIFFNLSTAYSKIISYNKTIILKKSGEIVFYEKKIVKTTNCLEKIKKDLNLNETYKITNTNIEVKFLNKTKVSGRFKEETSHKKTLIYEFENPVCNNEILIILNYTFFPGLILEKEDVDARIHINGEDEKIEELRIKLFSPEKINNSVFWVRPYFLNKKINFINETTVEIILKDIPSHEDIFVRTLFPKDNFTTGFFLGGNQLRNSIINYEEKEKNKEKMEGYLLYFYLFIIIVSSFIIIKTKTFLKKLKKKK